MPGHGVHFVGVLTIRALHFWGSVLGPPDFWKLPHKKCDLHEMQGQTSWNLEVRTANADSVQGFKGGLEVQKSGPPCM